MDKLKRLLDNSRIDLTIARVLVQLHTMTGYDLVQVGSVQDEE